MFRMNDEQLYVESTFETDWMDLPETIKKLESAAHTVLSDPLIANMAKIWDVTVEPSRSSKYDVLYLRMNTFSDGHGSKDELADHITSERDYFYEIAKRIEDESGLVFEE